MTPTVPLVLPVLRDKGGLLGAGAAARAVTRSGFGVSLPCRAAEHPQAVSVPGCILCHSSLFFQIINSEGGVPE